MGAQLTLVSLLVLIQLYATKNVRSLAQKTHTGKKTNTKKQEPGNENWKKNQDQEGRTG